MKEMTSDYARKLPTETLQSRLAKRPFNQTIIDELHKRANRISKCEIEGYKRLERERVKTVLHLGYKTEAYNTEKEALKEVKYTFEMLSPDEKRIWNGKIKSCKL